MKTLVKEATSQGDLQYTFSENHINPDVLQVLTEVHKKTVFMRARRILEWLIDQSLLKVTRL